MKKPKYIIFDCDGVLVDSEIIANRVEVEIKNKLGLQTTIEQQIQTFTGCAKNHPTLVAELKLLPADYLQMVDDRCAEMYKAELKAIANVTETLDLLTLPKCVASSSERDSLAWKLELTGLNRYFAPEAVFHGSLVARSKPEPDLFFYAMEKMGWKPEDCLVVEDSEHGVRAGRAAGLLVCGFLGGGHIFPGHADRLMKAGADLLVSDMRNILRLV